MNSIIQKSQWLHKRELENYQARKLTRYLRDVVLPFSAHYRELFKKNGLTADSIRSLDDLRRLPFTAKSDLLNTPEHPERAKEFVLVPDQHLLARRPRTILRAILRGRVNVRADFEREFRPIFMTSTTGRAADPVPFFYTHADIDNLKTAGRFVMEICAAQRDWRLLNLFPFAPHLAFWITHYAGIAFGVFVLSTGGGKVMGTDGNIRLLRKIGPDALIGMPTFLYHVLSQAADEGVRCPALKRIVLGGEKVANGMRRKLRALAQQLGASEVDVLATYGFTESKMAWAECPYPHDESPAGYHLHADLGIVEVVDPHTGDPVAEGESGEIVFTPLAARGSVVLRYRTGDNIEGGVVCEPCPFCGRRVPRLVGKISRNSEVKEMQLDKLKGTLVDFNALEHALDDAEQVGAWQIELRKRHDDPLELDELVLHVQRRAGVDEKKLASQLDARFAAGTEIHPNRIVFHSAEEMRELHGVGSRLKEDKVIDHRPKPADEIKRAPAPRELELVT
jgi:phenylacetate-CoA ligase